MHSLALNISSAAHASAVTLPPDVVVAAQECSRAWNQDTTMMELLVELGK
ncbi:MAG: hypothetical protein V3S14_05680 [Anaerolineae bacterium]